MSETMLIRRDDLNVREVEQETVIVDRDSGDVHQLNPTASYIWHLFDGETSIDQVKESVANEFSIDRDRAAVDVAAVVEQLRSLDLLIPSDNSV